MSTVIFTAGVRAERANRQSFGFLSLIFGNAVTSRYYLTWITRLKRFYISFPKRNKLKSEKNRQMMLNHKGRGERGSIADSDCFPYFNINAAATSPRPWDHQTKPSRESRRSNNERRNPNRIEYDPDQPAA